MKDFPRISDSELEIMNIIWDKNPITSETIINILSSKIDWTPQTIKTFINRLLKKEAINYTKEGRIYKYYPIVSKEDYVKFENKSFLKKVYKGALGMLFSNFLEDELLSEEEIDKIQKILEEKKTNLK